MMNGPAYHEDIFADAAIADPYPHYAAIRDLGPAVALPQHGVYAVGRYADVKRALLDHRHFISGRGVGMDETINRMASGTTIASDPPVHEKLRAVIAAPLMPGAVAELGDQIRAAADDLVARLAARRSFDAVADLARVLPVSIVSRLVGLPEDGREAMLDWAAATFDCTGPANARFRDALPRLSEMIAYTVERAGPDRVRPGSWAARIYAAADAGVVPREQVPALLLDYLGPSLDTTIFATAHLVHLLATHPDQWRLLRADSSLVPNAIDEAVRLESPIRAFTRLVAEDADVGGEAVKAGARLLLLYPSANRDERKWHEPERFDIQRHDAREHLGFGKGRHVCAGQHLARLEIQALVEAMLVHFESLEADKPVVQINNMLRGFSSLPIRVVE